MASKPPIQTLTERLLAARGMDYQFAAAVLKAHLEAIDDVGFALEMNRVTNPRIFGKLWSMGLSWERQVLCVARATELEGKVKE